MHCLQSFCPPGSLTKTAATAACLDAPAADTRWHAVLVPMQLGYRVVGAVLLLLPSSSSAASQAAAAAGFAASVGAADSQGTDGTAVSAAAAGLLIGAAPGPEAGTGQDVVAGENTGALLQPLLRTPGALEAIAACVAECCLGPVLPQVEQVSVGAALQAAYCRAVAQATQPEGLSHAHAQT